MKAKIIFSAIAMAFSVNTMAQEAVLAPVLSVSPIERQFTSYELTEPVCTNVQVPVERRVPVYQETHNHDAALPILGMIVGAVIGNQVFRGSDARGIGTFMGAAGGYAMTNNGSRHGHVVGYQSEITYQNHYSCNRRNELVTRTMIDGYRVVYEFQGQQRTIVMRTHPGAHVRVVTSYRVE